MLKIINYKNVLFSDIDGWIITDIMDIDMSPMHQMESYYRFQFKKNEDEIIMALHKEGKISRSDGKSLLYNLEGYYKSGTKTKIIQISKDSVQSRMHFAFQAMLYKLQHEN